MTLRSEEMLFKTPRRYPLLFVLFVITIAITLCAVWLFDHNSAGKSLFALANLVGPTTESLLHGDGLKTCTEAMGTPQNPICFHAARMPLPTLIVSLGVELFGNRYLAVAFFKAVLLLLPVELAIYLVWLRMPRLSSRRLATSVLLLVPFSITAFLANVVNLQVEEAYTYSFLALAVAILYFGADPEIGRIDSHISVGGFGLALLFALSVDGIYLSKSSMEPAVAVLLIAYLLMVRSAAQRALVLVIVLAAPIGWAVHQHHVSGRYSIGTSLDGINLHKGNNADFLNHYPPPPGDSLDRFDQDLNRGLYFGDEWSFNDYHQKAALDFLRTHPRATLQGDLRKLNVFFLSIHKVGSTDDHGLMRLIGIAGLLLFRIIFWIAIFCSVYLALRTKNRGDASLRMPGIIFLTLVAACTLPYLVGFAYTRHVSILIYPAVLLCCRMLTDSSQGYA